MESLNEFVYLILGLLLRVGIPAGITLGLVFIFTRLDSYWQAKALQARPVGQLQPITPGNSGCWEVNRCSEAGKSKCPAYAHKETPCWQVFRNKNGLLKERCLGCRVFQDAPIPIRVG